MGNNWLRVAGAALATCFGVGTAHASGFGLRESSADTLGNAFAGQTAKAYDAGSAWTNPAGMVRLNWNEIDGALNYIDPHATFRGQNFQGGVPTTGVPGSNAVQSAATAGTFSVWSYSPNLKFGLAVTSPFGERVSYPGNFVGRYQGLTSSITDVEATLSAAIKINNQLSIGAGPVIDFFHARLTQAISLGPLSAVTGDPVGDLSGNDTAVGFVASGLYQVSPALRFGLVYRSRIHHSISGDQSIYLPPKVAAIGPIANLLSIGNSQARSEITLPDNITGGVYYDVTPRLAVMADVQWTHWSLFKQLTIVPANGGPITSTPENWRNTWFGSVGASYRLTEKLMLQGGVGYDQSPTTDSNRTTRIPDYSRFLVGIGVTYAVLPNVNVQAAYLRLIDGNVNINNSASPGAGTIVGRYHDEANSASLGVAVKF